MWADINCKLLFSHSGISDSLQPHGLQHATLPCPSLSPRVCSNACLLSRWYQPTISSSLFKMRKLQIGLIHNAVAVAFTFNFIAMTYSYECFWGIWSDWSTSENVNSNIPPSELLTHFIYDVKLILVLTGIFNFVIFMLGYQFPLAITPIPRSHDVLENIVNLLSLCDIWDLKITVADQYNLYSFSTSTLTLPSRLLPENMNWSISKPILWTSSILWFWGISGILNANWIYLYLMIVDVA